MSQQEKNILKNIRNLVSYLDGSDIKTVDLELGDEKFYINRNISFDFVQSAGNVDEKSEEITSNDYVLKSEIVGNYYSFFGKNSSDSVEIGEYVKKGQKLCLIECLGIDHIIKSPVNGRIIKICRKDGDNVDFGRDLFTIETDESETI